MIQDIFVNLVVTDLAKTRKFWNELDFTFNETFSNENGLCLLLGDHMYAMLLLPQFFQTFTDKKIIDPKTDVQVLTAIGVVSREKVDEIVEKGVAAGGRETGSAQDHGWMYSRSLEDLDGHIWEIMFADASQIPAESQTT